MKLLKQVGLEDKAHEYRASSPAVRSSGWRSCGAMAMEPDVMLFDEPTSALDPEMVKDVLEGLSSSWPKRRGVRDRYA